MALEPSGEFKLEQHGAHHRRRCRRHPDQVVDRNRTWSKQVCDARAIVRVGVGRKRFAIAFAQGKCGRALHNRLDRLDDVGGLGDQRRALLDQIVGAGRPRIERRTRHGKHFAALFGRHPCGDQ